MATKISDAEREQWFTRHLPYRIKCLRGLELRKKEPDLRVKYPGIFEGTLITCRWAGQFFGLRAGGMGIGLSRYIPPKQFQNTDLMATDIGGELIDPKNLDARIAVVIGGAHTACAHPVREGQHGIKPQHVDFVAAFFLKEFNLFYKRLGREMPEWDGR